MATIPLSFRKGPTTSISIRILLHIIVSIEKNFNCQNWFRIGIIVLPFPLPCFLFPWPESRSPINLSFILLYSVIQSKCEESSILFYPSLTQFKWNYLIQFQLTDTNLPLISPLPSPFSYILWQYQTQFCSISKQWSWIL